MEQEIIEFKPKYWLRFYSGEFNPFTGTKLMVDGNFIKTRRRNWYYISTDTNSYNIEKISVVNVDKRLFGATIEIKFKDDKTIEFVGYNKKVAEEIMSVCNKRIELNSELSTSMRSADKIANAMATAMGSAGKGNQSAISVADEILKLKQLLDQEIITQQEFEHQKRQLLNM